MQENRRPANDHRRGTTRRRALPVRRTAALGGALVVAIVVGGLASCGDSGPTGPSAEVIARGKEIFRFDTFGDEKFWTDTLRMHEVIQQAVTPAVALSVGLRVDVDALPQAVKDALA